MRILLIGLSLLSLLLKSAGATFLVSNTNDSGPGSLRQAILNANATNGFDRIEFRIPGAGVQTIMPLTPLPALTDSAALDATTQPGYANQPLVELDGSNVSEDAGLKLVAGNSVVRGLVINRFGTDGIQVLKGGTNLIQGNFIGTDSSGAVGRPNRREGLWLSESFGNLIGGTNQTDRNVIAGNGEAGLYILDGAMNCVQGNLIGLTVLGTEALPNGNHGIILYNSCANQIGGPQSAANSISGNRGSGIYLNGPGATRNLVQGNYIGTNSGGDAAVGNKGDGITLISALDNLIGGTNPGEGNLVSGNGKTGVYLSGLGALSNRITGNLIGTDLTGTLALPNAYAGITLSEAAHNVIGGSTPGARNIISGNAQDGIFLSSNSTANVIAGNWIGVDATGLKPLPNHYNGISLSGACSNTIGGLFPGSGNVISGNTGYGVNLLSGARTNVLQGNYVGSDNSGGQAVANGLSGIRVESDGNQIGGESGLTGNLISGNHDDGLWLVGTQATNNVVHGNYVGTDLTGRTVLSNGRSGIGLSDAGANTIGGALAGQGNLLSGNAEAGIYLMGAEARQNRILGNTIGSDVTGSKELGNGFEGVYIENASSNIVGGNQSGQGNLISGNHTRGIYLTNASWNIIQGNHIGTAHDRVSPLGNKFHNIECEAGSANNLIGGEGSAANEIAYAGTLYAGVRIRNGSLNNAILGNSIFGNGALDIDLGPAGVTPNDDCDVDEGANHFQNFPVLNQAITGRGISICGSLNSSPSSMFLVQFFASAPAATAGPTARQIYLGELLANTDPNCETTFTATFPAAVADGFIIRATATDTANNTSEFSAPVAAQAAPILSLTIIPESGIRIQWNASPSGLVLMEASNLAPPVTWTLVTNAAAFVDGQWTVSIPSASGQRFYTLGPQ